MHVLTLTINKFVKSINKTIHQSFNICKHLIKKTHQYTSKGFKRIETSGSQHLLSSFSPSFPSSHCSSGWALPWQRAGLRAHVQGQQLEGVVELTEVLGEEADVLQPGLGIRVQLLSGRRVSESCWKIWGKKWENPVKFG